MCSHVVVLDLSVMLSWYPVFVCACTVVSEVSARGGMVALSEYMGGTCGAV